MIEFGENLKRSRQAKGMTQQTLADQLYVTRQAVSRWENGARYPGLLTAKKLAALLDTSLDELLSGEEWNPTPENSPIVESPALGGVQSALYAFSGAMYLLLSVFALRNLPGIFLETDPSSLPLVLENCLEYFLYAGAMLLGLYFSVRGSLTPRKSAVILSSYFGLRSLRFIGSLCQSIQFAPLTVRDVLGTLLAYLPNLIFLAVIAGFYLGRSPRSPIPFYCVCALYTLVLLYNYLFPYLAPSVMIEGDPDYFFMARTISLAAQICFMGVVAGQAYLLQKKRRLLTNHK